MHHAEAGWIDIYSRKGALWIHDMNPQRPHALLTSGKHSNGFFNSELVMEDPDNVDVACLDLIHLLKDRNFDFNSFDRVVGPAMGAITLAHNLASRLRHHRKYPCLRAYTEKATDTKFVVVRDDQTIEIEASEVRSQDKIVEVKPAPKTMAFKRTNIRPGERILLVEDVLTTGGSVELTTQAVKEAGGIVLPFVVTLVNRSGNTQTNGGMEIVSLINRLMPTWDAEDCLLCKQGSKGIRPKGTENWALLNAEY